MVFKLSYVAQFVATDADGNPDGDVFEVQGFQLINTNAPQTSDITDAATALGTDMGNKMATAYPVQVVQDSGAPGTGGEG